jgi:hypothetical protein
VWTYWQNFWTAGHSEEEIPCVSLDEEWRQEDIRMKRLKAGKEKLEGVDKIEEEAAKVPITKEYL